ncbi:hypothetical protein E2562_001831 [Oryza meyeriana var. granulata]|uniref:NAC domain-containing protein n=1 Tax=Oryza meyeriana var. granulata TaxID=110450 RepID=A0A6G1CDT6_9ORYZ|nr:hypothetical protein E2562_001831 [Oryza meyeriana var. granulata]
MENAGAYSVGGDYKELLDDFDSFLNSYFAGGTSLPTAAGMDIMSPPVEEEIPASSQPQPGPYTIGDLSRSTAATGTEIPRQENAHPAFDSPGIIAGPAQPAPDPAGAGDIIGLSTTADMEITSHLEVNAAAGQPQQGRCLVVGAAGPSNGTARPVFESPGVNAQRDPDMYMGPRRLPARFSVYGLRSAPSTATGKNVLPVALPTPVVNASPSIPSGASDQEIMKFLADQIVIIKFLDDQIAMPVMRKDIYDLVMPEKDIYDLLEGNISLAKKDPENISSDRRNFLAVRQRGFWRWTSHNQTPKGRWVLKASEVVYGYNTEALFLGLKLTREYHTDDGKKTDWLMHEYISTAFKDCHLHLQDEMVYRKVFQQKKNNNGVSKNNNDKDASPSMDINGIRDSVLQSIADGKRRKRGRDAPKVLHEESKAWLDFIRIYDKRPDEKGATVVFGMCRHCDKFLEESATL